jgi:LytS/YehU family sensor histidine kinase
MKDEFGLFCRGNVVNIFMIVGFAATWWIAQGWFPAKRRSIHAPVHSGLLFGLMATVAMLAPVYAGQDFFFDSRAGAVGACALLFGPVAALASLPMPIAYRFFVGGAGVAPGVIELVLPAVLGVVLHRIHGGDRTRFRFSLVMACSVISAAMTYLAILAFVSFHQPAGTMDVGPMRVVAVMVSCAVSMALLSSLILIEDRHSLAVLAEAEAERWKYHSQKMAALGQLAAKIAHSVLNALPRLSCIWW